MKITNFPKLALTIVALAAVVFTGCKSTVLAPDTPRQFASLRIMNFTSSDSTDIVAPVDVYFFPASQTVPDTLAKVNNLQFGQSSVYTNTLPADVGGSSYSLTVTPARQRPRVLLNTQVVLLPGHQYTYIVYNKLSDRSQFEGQLVEDDITPTGADPTKTTFVRFINVYPNSPNLVASVNDPYSKDLITPSAGVAYREVAPYVALGTALDTSYAFYVYPAGQPENVIGKISYQSFAPGSFHTVVYAGDLARTGTQMGDPLDSLRVRVFDDNSLGNEETTPIPQSIRYFIVNALIPNADVPPTTKFGFVVANDANPDHFNFTFDPVDTFSLAPNYGGMDSQGFPQAQFASTSLSTWLAVRAVATDAQGNSPKLIFDAHAPQKLNQIVGPGESTSMVPDNSYSIVFFDTIPPADRNDSSSMGRMMTSVLLPDQRYADSTTLVFVNATAPSKKFIPTSSSNYATFIVDGTEIGGTFPAGRAIAVNYPVGAHTITVQIGNSANKIDIPGSTTINTAGASEYEIVLMGQRSDATYTSQYPSRLKVFTVHQ